MNFRQAAIDALNRFHNGGNHIEGLREIVVNSRHGMPWFFDSTFATSPTLALAYVVMVIAAEPT